MRAGAPRLDGKIMSMDNKLRFAGTLAGLTVASLHALPHHQETQFSGVMTFVAIDRPNGANSHVPEENHQPFALRVESLRVSSITTGPMYRSGLVLGDKYFRW